MWCCVYKFSVSRTHLSMPGRDTGAILTTHTLYPPLPRTAQVPNAATSWGCAGFTRQCLPDLHRSATENPVWDCLGPTAGPWSNTHPTNPLQAQPLPTHPTPAQPRLALLGPQPSLVTASRSTPVAPRPVSRGRLRWAGEGFATEHAVKPLHQRLRRPVHATTKRMLPQRKGTHAAHSADQERET